jgi:hypothetical protein
MPGTCAWTSSRSCLRSLTIAADPKHLGARIGITAVLRTWGSAMTHHPHIHMIVTGGGLTPAGQWISSRPAFLLPVRVLGALFRRLFLTRLLELHGAGKLVFFGKLTELSDRRVFLRHLAPIRRKRWVVYAKAPFAGPEAVLAYLSRSTHRVAISNSRLIAFDQTSVTFRYKNYRCSGVDRQQVMTLAANEFIRRSCCMFCRTGGGRDLRPAPALPLRRRHHGHHRNLRTVVPAAGPTHVATINPGDRS